MQLRNEMVRLSREVKGFDKHLELLRTKNSSTAQYAFFRELVRLLELFCSPACSEKYANDLNSHLDYFVRNEAMLSTVIPEEERADWLVFGVRYRRGEAGQLEERQWEVMREEGIHREESGAFFGDVHAFKMLFRCDNDLCSIHDDLIHSFWKECVAMQDR